jgi:hypothetical protein
MIELGWMWLRHQPTSTLSRWYLRRFARGNRRLRKVGIVALARNLLIALWRYLETGEPPQGAGLKGQKLTLRLKKDFAAFLPARRGAHRRPPAPPVSPFPVAGRSPIGPCRIAPASCRRAGVPSTAPAPQAALSGRPRFENQGLDPRRFIEGTVPPEFRADPLVCRRKCRDLRECANAPILSVGVRDSLWPQVRACIVDAR